MITERRVLTFGNSKVITLPPEFADNIGDKAIVMNLGDQICLVVSRVKARSLPIETILDGVRNLLELVKTENSLGQNGGKADG